MLLQILNKAFTLFLILDSFGAMGLIMGLVGPFSLQEQKRILRREMLISLFIMVAFYFFGTLLLDVLDISQAAVQITGAVILFLFALTLLFPKESGDNNTFHRKEPYIVPIAIPMIAGPSCLATLMLYAHETHSSPLVNLSALVLAWAATSVIILSSPFLIRQLGKTGVSVLERLMALIVTMLAVGMFTGGISTFIASL